MAWLCEQRSMKGRFMSTASMLMADKLNVGQAGLATAAVQVKAWSGFSQFSITGLHG